MAVATVSAQVDYALVPFDAAHGAPVTDIAELHAELLAHSPVALLGPDFMERFYYAVLPELDLIFGSVAYVDRRPAGFIVATGDSAGFMQAAIRRAFGRLAWTMASSLLRHPSRLGAAREARAIMRGVKSVEAPRPVGELLSFAVRPAFRERQFVARTGLRISQDLLRSAMQALRARGVTVSRAIVDADNLEARLFYLGNGWQPGAAKVPGWRKETVEFLWHA
jgi:ribosomal protein S18 acetylase RimI-like enzyme